MKWKCHITAKMERSVQYFKLIINLICNKNKPFYFLPLSLTTFIEFSGCCRVVSKFFSVFYGFFWFYHFSDSFIFSKSQFNFENVSFTMFNFPASLFCHTCDVCMLIYLFYPISLIRSVQLLFLEKRIYQLSSQQ